LIRKFNVGDEEAVLEGAVEAVRVVRDSRTNVGRGVAYVLFRNRTAVLAALGLQGTLCCGRAIRVSRIKPAAGGGAPSGSSVSGAARRAAEQGRGAGHASLSRPDKAATQRGARLLTRMKVAQRLGGRLHHARVNCGHAEIRLQHVESDC
jgi:RNA recognition motif. (a.k.a. RRM, RBD, or RNP domain)